MANEEHLNILKQGMAIWNQWRMDNPSIVPDLSQSNLSQYSFESTNLELANLSQSQLGATNFNSANLSRANLSGAYAAGSSFVGAHLEQATLRKTSFKGATFRDASLSKADLNSAILILADIRDADLSDADMTGVDFQNAVIKTSKLSQTILTNSIFGNTSLSNLDLASVVGLETIRHYNPSSLGVDTIFRSHGSIPRVFLQRCGIPMDFITYLPSLMGRAINYYSCFISYSHDDVGFARRLYDTLYGRGIECYIDEMQMNPGDDIYTEIDRGITHWDKTI